MIFLNQNNTLDGDTTEEKLFCKVYNWEPGFITRRKEMVGYSVIRYESLPMQQHRFLLINKDLSTIISLRARYYRSTLNPDIFKCSVLEEAIAQVDDLDILLPHLHDFVLDYVKKQKLKNKL